MSTPSAAEASTSSSGTSARPIPWTMLDWTLLTTLIAAALWIRLTHIDPGLSFDELWHLASTQGIGSAMSYYAHDVVHHQAISLTSLDHKRSLWHVWSGMDGILHPPLFIVALRLWRDVLGTSDLVAHGFSIFCGIASVAFTFLTARLAMNRVAGFLASMALACSQTQVYFSQEVRAYAMMIALGSIALWLMTRIELLGPSRRRVIGLALLTLPLMLTHYFAAGACLAIAIYGLLATGRHRKAFAWSLLASAATYAIIWLPFAIQQLNDLQTGDSFLKLDKGPLHVVLLAAGTPFRLLVERDYQMERTPLLSAMLFIVPWFLIKRLRPLLPWSIWLCASVAPIMLLDLTRTTVHGQFIRYLAVATPAVPVLFIGTVLAIGWRRVAYALGGALCFTGAIYLYSDARIPIDADDLTEAARMIERRYRPGDAIVTSAVGLPPYFGEALAMTISHSRAIFPTTLLIADGPLSPQLVEQLGTQSIWLVSGELSMAVNEFVPGGRIDYDAAATPSVRVRHIVIEPPAQATRPFAEGSNGVAEPSR